MTNTASYTHDASGGLTSATLPNQNFTYSYDDIGNRTSSSVNTAATLYTANALNQYTSVSAPSAPPREPAYDPDGNLLTDGALIYTWDDENRLVSSTPALPAPGPRQAINRYDHRHRRVLKTVNRRSGGGWVLEREHAFVWDGWLPLAETVTSGGQTNTVEYFWGTDLSGSEQGAGGVGGLLAVSVDGQFHLPCYDHNGNIIAYVSESGACSAVYTYDAYGNLVSQSGSMADSFRFRFSTKYHDPETGQYYYGRRFYDPPTGRWLNRDPIEEEGGVNLYAFVGNDPLNNFDILGMAEGKVTHPPWWLGGEVQDASFAGNKLGEARAFLLKNECTCVCKDDIYYLQCQLSLSYTIKLEVKTSLKWKTLISTSYPTWPVPDDYASWTVKQKRKFTEKHERKHVAAYTAWHEKRLGELSARETLMFSAAGCAEQIEHTKSENQSLFNIMYRKEMAHEDW